MHVKNANEFGQFQCEDDAYCCWDGSYRDLIVDDSGDAVCPKCKLDVYEVCPFCGDQFDTNTRICGHCKEQV